MKLSSFGGTKRFYYTDSYKCEEYQYIYTAFVK